MIILGIDPGTATTGFGVVAFRAGNQLTSVDYGVVKTPAHTPLTSRLQTIFREMGEIIESHRPDAISVEQLFFSRNTSTAFSVGQARGVLLLAAAEAGVSVAEYTPNQVKQAVTGVGNAPKKQVAYMVRQLLNLADTPQPDDAADALAIAMCHAYSFAGRQRVQAAMQRDDGGGSSL